MSGTKPALDDPQASAPWPRGRPPPGTVVLDEMVPKRLRDALRDGGFDCYHIRELFRTTEDEALLRWCRRHGYVLVTNNCSDFNRLDDAVRHSGLLLYPDQEDAVRRTGRMVDEVKRIDRRKGLSDLTDQVRWLSP